MAGYRHFMLLLVIQIFRATETSSKGAFRLPANDLSILSWSLRHSKFLDEKTGAQNMPCVIYNNSRVYDITSKTPFGRWTSAREHMCLNCARLQVPSCGYPPSFAKLIASGPLTTHQVSAQSVQSLPRYEKGCARVQLCPTLDFCKSLVNGSLAT